MQTIQGDNRCQELWHLLQETRKQENVTLDDIIKYRREAERHVGADDHLYRIDCVSVSILTLPGRLAEIPASRIGIPSHCEYSLLALMTPVPMKRTRPRADGENTAQATCPSTPLNGSRQERRRSRRNPTLRGACCPLPCLGLIGR